MQIDFGVERQAFRFRYFEQQPMFRAGAFDVSGYGWDLIDHALDRQDCSRERFKVLRNGRVAPETYVEEYVDVGLRQRRIRKDQLYRLLSEGATIVLNRIELVSPATLDICMQVGRFVGAQTTANAYASFGGDAATNVHWDTHDVVVVQLAGRKHWRLYEPTHSLPISSQTSSECKDDVPMVPVFDRVLEAGDILYVPRGWWHRVVPVDGSDTLHLTVAIHTPLILDYLVWACSSLLPEHLELRHSLLGEAADTERVAAAADLISRLLKNPEALDAFYQRSRERERAVAPFNIDLLLRRGGEILAPTTRVMLNSRHASDAKPALINGHMTELPELHQRVVSALAGMIECDVGHLRSCLVDLDILTVDTLLRELALNEIIRMTPAAAPRFKPTIKPAG